jgi:hypothetical protein
MKEYLYSILHHDMPVNRVFVCLVITMQLRTETEISVPQRPGAHAISIAAPREQIPIVYDYPS